MFPWRITVYKCKTVLQILHARAEDNLDYDVPWANYREGFGDPSADYWIGILSYLSFCLTLVHTHMNCRFNMPPYL